MSAYGAAFERLGGFVAAIAGAGAGVGIAGRGGAATGAILGGMVGVPNSRRTSAAGSIVLMGATVKLHSKLCEARRPASL